MDAHRPRYLAGGIWSGLAMVGLTALFTVLFEQWGVVGNVLAQSLGWAVAFPIYFWFIDRRHIVRMTAASIGFLVVVSAVRIAFGT